MRGLGGEALRELLGAAHRLAEQDARDRERLRDERAHVGQAALLLGGDPLALVADAARQPDEERQQREAEDRQAPVEQQHRDDRREHGRRVGDDRRRGRRDDVLHAADVVGDPRLHLAGARAREEGERQALQVAVDGGAQVVHDALADEVRQPRLTDADHAGGDRDEDHPADEPAQQRRVAVGDRRVEHVAQQKRRDHAEAGADRDQPEHRAESRLVRAKEGGDAACLRTEHGRTSVDGCACNYKRRGYWRRALRARALRV